MSVRLNEMQTEMSRLRAKLFPNGEGEVWLYGSRARGDYHEDSDWDLLVILENKDSLKKDYDRYAYPFVELGWDYDQAVIPVIYSRKEWIDSNKSMFYHNVLSDRILI